MQYQSSIIRNALYRGDQNPGVYCLDKDNKNMCLNNFYAVNSILTDANNPIVSWGVMIPYVDDRTKMSLIGRSEILYKRLAILLSMLDQSMITALVSVSD